MREDMAKVIVERPRYGSRKATTDDPKGWNKKKFGNSHPDMEDLPSKESMSAGRKHGYDRKQLNEHLNPLYRYLDKQVGRPWDKVYSEICERIRLTSTVQRHILQHVDQHVATAVFAADDGTPMVNMGWGGARPVWDYHDLYVHPVDGLLKRVKVPKGYKSPYRYQPWHQPKRCCSRVDGPDRGAVKDCKTWHQFHKIDGVWFVAELAKIPLPLTETHEIELENGVKDSVVVPNENGRLRDACLGRALYNLRDEKKNKDISVKRFVKFTEEQRGNRPFSFKDFKGGYYDETLTGLYGVAGWYAVSYKQANGKELKWANLKNDPPPTEAEEKAQRKAAEKKK